MMNLVHIATLPQNHAQPSQAAQALPGMGPAQALIESQIEATIRTGRLAEQSPRLQGLPPQRDEYVRRRMQNACAAHVQRSLLAARTAFVDAHVAAAIGADMNLFTGAGAAFWDALDERAANACAGAAGPLGAAWQDSLASQIVFEQAHLDWNRNAAAHVTRVAQDRFMHAASAAAECR